MPAKPSRLVRNLVLLLIWVGAAFGGVLLYFGYDLPDKISFEVANQRRAPIIRIISVDGQTLAEVGDRYGRPVEAQDLSRATINAFLTAEDRRFYDHWGIDILGIMRAAWVNFTAGSAKQGGSTITQQLAKNLFLSPDKTFTRKIQEAILAVWLEYKFTKDQILSLYLNRIYFGDGMFGIAAASRAHFAKHPSKLTVFESAVLAAMPKAPNRYHPRRAPVRTAQRANLILQMMADRGVLSHREANRSKKQRVITRNARTDDNSIRYFTDWVLQQIPDYIGYHSKDIIVKTTLDSRLQQVAQTNVERMLSNTNTKDQQIGQAALIALTPDGAIRAMVGGRDYGISQFNRVTQAQRQAGSAFKLFVYLAGLQSGFKPQTWMNDQPVQVGDWNPRNFDRTFRGKVSVRDSFGESINSIAVQMGLDVGLDRVIDEARKLGINSDIPDDATITLGSSTVTMLELAGAYAVIANGGYNVFPHTITEITESRGKREVLYKRDDSFPGRLVSPIVIGQMSNLLSYVISHGTGKTAILDRPAAGKTGTTSDYRDAWFIGYTAELVAGVWVGNDDNRPMRNVTGSTFPARLWRDFMLHAHRNLPVRSLGKAALNRAEQRGEGEAWKKFTSGFAGD